MKIEAKNNCPLNNFETCKQLECSWFIKVAGHNPNTGKDIEEWGCAIDGSDTGVGKTYSACGVIRELDMDIFNTLIDFITKMFTK